MLRGLGLIKSGEKLPWDLNNKETKRFCDTWSAFYRHFDTKIRRQKKRGNDVSKHEQKLKDAKFICPDIFPHIFGGIVPCRRKEARKRT